MITHLDPDYLDSIARCIAWAHWRAMNPAETPAEERADEWDLWNRLDDRHRTAYRAAAQAVPTL